MYVSSMALPSLCSPTTPIIAATTLRYRPPFHHLTSNLLHISPISLPPHPTQSLSTPLLVQNIRSNPRLLVRSSKEGSSSEVVVSRSRLVVSSAVTVVLAVANHVLYKLALVPMKQYPFFLAQITTFGYVVIYFSILFTRYCLGIVTEEMMAIPKSPFVIIGILEALGVAAGMSSGAMLPGPAIPMLNQAFLAWQLLFAFLLLGRRFSWSKISGCLLVVAGVIVAVASGSDCGYMFSGIAFVWPVLMIASTAFLAAASIIKESVFVDYSNRFKGKLLDIFVVNSFGSGFQALFVLLFLPFLSSLKGIPFSQLPLYLKNGAGCFLNSGSHSIGCSGAPLLPLLYIATNIAFNISVLNLLKISSALVSSLVVMSTVPISIYALSLPLPYLPEGASLSSSFLLGNIILVIGLILYNTTPHPRKQDI